MSDIESPDSVFGKSNIATPQPSPPHPRRSLFSSLAAQWPFTIFLPVVLFTWLSVPFVVFHVASHYSTPITQDQANPPNRGAEVSPANRGAEQWGISGTIGDTFGAVNALFTALSVALIVWTLRQQSESLRLQQDALREQIKEIQLSTQALELSNKEFKEQKEEMRGQKEALIDGRKTHERAIKIESHLQSLLQINRAMVSLIWRETVGDNALNAFLRLMRDPAIRTPTVRHSHVLDILPMIALISARVHFSAQLADKEKEPDLKAHLIELTSAFIPLNLNNVVNEIKNSETGGIHANVGDFIRNYDLIPGWAKF